MVVEDEGRTDEKEAVIPPSSDQHMSGKAKDIRVEALEKTSNQGEESVTHSSSISNRLAFDSDNKVLPAFPLTSITNGFELLYQNNQAFLNEHPEFNNDRIMHDFTSCVYSIFKQMAPQTCYALCQLKKADDILAEVVSFTEQLQPTYELGLPQNEVVHFVQEMMVQYVAQESGIPQTSISPIEPEIVALIKRKLSLYEKGY